uniref:BED-type domain-containing protein n=1 Tax=Globodera rostochiensis TaxID=31243 RepID=A0A914IHM8_GLORO
MEEFWILILISLFATNTLDKTESVKVKLEETQLKTFDEIFGEGWWDKDEAAEDLKMPAPTNFGQNVHHQIDRQNTQIEQIEPNSIDQNPPLTESDHKDEQKQKFDQMKAELMRDGFKNSYHHEIDKTVAKELGLSYTTIYNWKRELDQTAPQHKYSHSEQKELLKDGKGNLNNSRCIQILSMDILWKRMPRQMFRELGPRIQRLVSTTRHRGTRGLGLFGASSSAPPFWRRVVSVRIIKILRSRFCDTCCCKEVSASAGLKWTVKTPPGGGKRSFIKKGRPVAQLDELPTDWMEIVGSSPTRDYHFAYSLLYVLIQFRSIFAPKRRLRSDIAPKRHSKATKAAEHGLQITT